MTLPQLAIIGTACYVKKAMLKGIGKGLACVRYMAEAGPEVSVDS